MPNRVGSFFPCPSSLNFGFWKSWIRGLATLSLLSTIKLNGLMNCQLGFYKQYYLFEY